jgi:hypothetical protein
MARPRSLLVALAIAGAPACSDPSLRIEVIPVDGLAADTTVVTVYEPEADDVTCDDVEFGAVTAAELELAFTAEAVVEDGEALTGVSRLGTKLFVAEGRAGTRRLYAGCEQRGDITGDETVTITTAAIATITVSGGQLDLPFAAREIRVAAVDPDGRALDQRRIRWESYGVSGAFAPDAFAASPPDVCTDQGLATLEPADPTTPGPIAAQIRVSWAETTPPPLSGFIQHQPPTVDLRELGAATRQSPACALRREVTGGGDPVDHVYCLKRALQPDDPRRVVEVELDVDADTLALRPTASLVQSNHLIATRAESGPPVTDALYAIELAGDRIQLVGIAGTPSPPSFDPCTAVAGACALDEIRRAVVVPGCGAGAGFIAISFATGDATPDAIVFTDLAGALLPIEAPVLGAARFELLAGGCVAEATTAGTQHQAFAVRVTPFDPELAPFNTLVALCDGAPCTARWPGFAAVGFSVGPRPRLLSSEVDITGNVVVESEIIVGGAELGLIERGRTPTTAAARSITSADVDGDGAEDLAWSQFLIGEASTVNRVQLAIGRTDLPFPGRLTGLSPELDGSQAVLLFARMDGDAAPDLLTFTDEQVALYRSGVSVPPLPAAGLETTCD